MKTNQPNLKIYEIKFIPIIDCKFACARRVLIVALSSDQATKIFNDWMMGKRQNYFLEGIERKFQKECKEYLKFRGKKISLKERFIMQNLYIYKRERWKELYNA